MYRLLLVVILFFLSLKCFAQTNSSFEIIGAIPPANSDKLYQIQVAAFRETGNAKNTYERLFYASLNPLWIQEAGFIKLVIPQIIASDVLKIIDRIRMLGFSQIIVMEEQTRGYGQLLPLYNMSLPEMYDYVDASRSTATYSRPELPPGESGGLSGENQTPDHWEPASPAPPRDASRKLRDDEFAELIRLIKIIGVSPGRIDGKGQMRIEQIILRAF
jgi:hypothetical protein